MECDIRVCACREIVGLRYLHSVRTSQFRKESTSMIVEREKLELGGWEVGGLGVGFQKPNDPNQNKPKPSA
jgi:hypothetical protein